MPTYVGILEEVQRGGMVRTTGKENVGDIFIPENKLNGAPFGMLVQVEVSGELPLMNPQGKIIEVIGDPALPDVAILGIIKAYGLQERFTEEELQAAAEVPAELSEEVITFELQAGRKDLRTLRTLTIDGKDAKDLDDAISIMSLPDGGYRLWVHIADVSYYVKEDEALDKAALLRGNSAYLADRVLPMLPPRLSNGICSLNQGKARLALTCMLDYNAYAQVSRGEVFESIICSDLRANYEEVYAAVYEDHVVESYRNRISDLKLMRELAEKLKKNREVKGSLNFEFPETKVLMNTDGTVADIQAYPINAANGIIEEFMIAANVFIAKRFKDLGAPFLYRIHENPDPVKFGRFLDVARVLGFKTKGINLNDTLSLSKLLDRVNESCLAPLLSQLLLPSLAKAVYSDQPLGHFGLAEKDYTHFTSPIRRYPDLFIHRVIKGYLSGKIYLKRWKKKTATVAEQCSVTERNAMAAEYATVDQKVAEFMKDHLGEAYPAQVVGMMPSGAFVRLPNTVEGFLPFRLMEDYYEFDELRLEAYGKRSGRKLKIGDSIDVLVARADTINRQVDFAPIGTDLRLLPERPRPESVFDRAFLLKPERKTSKKEKDKKLKSLKKGSRRKGKAGTNKPKKAKKKRR